MKFFHHLVAPSSSQN